MSISEHNEFIDKAIKIKKKNLFTPEEDEAIIKLVDEFGENWKEVAKKMISRSSRQCRERWCYYLSPLALNSPWTSNEDRLLKKYYKKFGNKWAQIAGYIGNKTSIQVKCRWMKFQRKIKKKSVNQINVVKEKKEKPIKKSNKINILDMKEKNDESTSSILNFEHIEGMEFFGDLITTYCV